MQNNLKCFKDFFPKKNKKQEKLKTKQNKTKTHVRFLIVLVIQTMHFADKSEIGNVFVFKLLEF